MKKLTYIFIGAVLVVLLGSCKEWLDVNTDPDSPTNSSAEIANRLPWIEQFFTKSHGAANHRSSCIAGVWYDRNGVNNYLSTTWAFSTSSCTSAYQMWFVATACNIQDLYDKAEEEGAYYYMAAAELYHAMGFMMMLDLHGEMPYTEALSSNAVPAHDDGKTIYNGCLEKIDHAIELLGMTQEDGATALSSGDPMFSGDVDKWTKFAYGLKARYLNRISKKSDLYDPDLILECLEKGPQSISDNALMIGYNSESDEGDYMVSDPVTANGNWCYTGQNHQRRVSKFLVDKLLNMRDSGVEDPRYTKIVPAAMCNIKLNSDGTIASYDWLRSQPVDQIDDEDGHLQLGGATCITPYLSVVFSDDSDDLKTKVKESYEGHRMSYDFSSFSDSDREEFIASWEGSNKEVLDFGDSVVVHYPLGSIYSTQTSYYSAGDTVYVPTRANASCGYAAVSEMNMNYFYGHNDATAIAAGAVASTSSFQIRPVSRFELLTYHEMCFIKAEVYFRQGNTSAALSAYQDGIQANLDYMQSVLEEWEAGGYAEYNPDMGPMDDSAISAYMKSDAVCQSAAELTMADIMLQKYVAMGTCVENWVDLRRFNFSAGNVEDFGVVYPGFERSKVFAGSLQLSGTSPTDPKYWPRRLSLPPTYELSYNATNALACNPNCMNDDIWCYPVWWDCETDSEYYGYLGRSE